MSAAEPRAARSGPAARKGDSLFPRDAAFSNREGASLPVAVTRRAASSGRRVDDQAGGSWSLLAALVEPRLQQNRRRHAVDEVTPLARRNTTLPQAPRRLDGRQALVDELDLDACCVGERLSKTSRADGFTPLSTSPVEWQPYEKAADRLRGREPNELRDDLARLPARERGTRVRDQPELIGHGQPHTYLPEIDGRYTHPVGPTL
jgi:hypothetical protein